MSNAWEITTADVETVLRAHGAVLSADKVEELLDGLDHAEIEKGLLHYTDIEEQADSALSDIEDSLLKQGVISGEKKFKAP